MRRILLLALLALSSLAARASYVLLPMDDTQTNHLKAYGVAYWVLQQNVEVDWLLNYQGGSFMFRYDRKFENELNVRGVSYQVISDAQQAQITAQVSQPDVNMDVMRLDKPPKIAVYSPKSKQPWDDAVTLVLVYAEIPYEIVYDSEVLDGKLPRYDWLHLHHEDFTGQHGKFYRTHGNAPWYRAIQKEDEATAMKYGFSKVSQMKLNVVKKARDFCAGGGFLFAMCSAADTYDIALSADGVDICESVYDGDPSDPNAQKKLDFNNTFAFQNFTLNRDPFDLESSDIDNQPYERGLSEGNDFFSLFQFSAKWDPIPTMLTQSHQTVVKGFLGQTTGFKKNLLKPDVVVMGETRSINEVKYIHGTMGKGTWTFYGGHDPEDYQHLVNEEATDLTLHPNSAGYRLILNNILFPAARKKKQKT
jgi:hypothetical protein